MALGVALLRFVVPRQQLGSTIGWNALAVALSSAAGPTIGAIILSVATWPWLFAVNLPLGVVVLFAARSLPCPAGTDRRLDLISVLLNAGVIASLVIGADLALAMPTLAVALFAAAVLGLALLVRRERHKEAPLIPLDLFRVDAFRIAVVASILCFAGQAMSMVALPFYLQHGLKQSILMTGLYMTSWPLTVALAAPVVGRLANGVSAKWLCATGGLCLAIGLAAAALWPRQDGPLLLIPFTVLCGLGFSLFNVPNNRTMFLSAPRARSGAAGGMQGSARLVGQTAGGVITTLLFASASADTAPRIGFAIAASLTLAAGITSALRSGRLAHVA
jgi:DHA2 family multidrug resistance protein-like MFS transporter